MQLPIIGIHHQGGSCPLSSANGAANPGRRQLSQSLTDEAGCLLAHPQALQLCAHRGLQLIQQGGGGGNRSPTHRPGDIAGQQAA